MEILTGCIAVMKFMYHNTSHRPCALYPTTFLCIGDHLPASDPVWEKPHVSGEDGREIAMVN